MKEKFFKFLNTIGSYLLLLIIAAVGVFGVITEFFPAMIPNWVYIVAGIINIPFFIAFFTMIWKEWRKQRKAKKEESKRQQGKAQRKESLWK